jgi:predicted PurR-regulated permease PerM
MGPALDVLMTAAMVLLFAFLMLLRRDDLGDRFIRIVGHGKILVTTRALEDAAKKVSSYLWRSLLLNGLHGLVVAIGLTFIGLPNAILWGLLAAILRFIPYIGPWIAAACPVLTSLAMFPGWSEPLMTFGLFLILELVSNNLLEPWIYGTGTGVSPLAILVSALFWTWL